MDKELSQGYVTIATLKEPSNKPEAVLLYNKGLVIAKRNKDYDTQLRIHINMSNLYLNDVKNSYLNKVYYHLQESTKINEVLKDNSLLFCIYFNYGACYFNKKEYDKALDYYKKALFLSKKNIESTQRLHLYEVISKLYIQKKDYESGFLFKEKYNNLKDSVYDVEKYKSFSEIETKYEVDKKNLKISLLTKDKEIQKNSKRTIILVSIVLLVLSLITVYFLRQRIKIQRIFAIKRQKSFQQEIVRLEQEQELERVNSILEGQDQERKRLAKEIHDGIGGSLAGIKLQLAQENALLKNEKIDIIINQMTAAFSELRSISHNLSFNFLKDKSLENLIHQLTLEYRNRHEFAIDVAVFPEDSLDMLSNAIKHNVYRIVQELIANVSKHAKANQVLINFTKHKKSLNIIFEDNGIGFEDANTKGIGIKNIKERIASQKGTIVIESIYGKGTTIIIDIPTNE